MATTTPGREASPVTTPDPRHRRHRRVITWTALAVVAVIAAVVAYWALAIIAAAAYLLISLVRLHKATNNNIPGQADEAKTAAAWAGGSLAALCGFAVIVGAVFTLAG